MKWSVLYRGPLVSCNYACPYCPFAKSAMDRAGLADDARKLERFRAWVADQRDVGIELLFTPWGEAAIHRHYQDAMAALSHEPHVARVAIQTNLSGSLAWLDGARPGVVGLWATYHPGEVERARFLDACARARSAGARLSVGVVGLPGHVGEVEAVREALPPEVYVWVNAVKRIPYAPGERARLQAVDPLFGLNVAAHPSLGHACAAGETSFAVDGDGVARRCHFVPEPIGNIHDRSFRDALRPRRCPNETCGCHIGYVHLKRLGLRPLFGAGLMERIPESWGRPLGPEESGLS